jgi:hypothetical protein
MRSRPIQVGDHFARRHAPRRLFRIERIDKRDGIPHARLWEVGAHDLVTIAVPVLQGGDWVRQPGPEAEER